MALALAAWLPVVPAMAQDEDAADAEAVAPDAGAAAEAGGDEAAPADAPSDAAAPDDAAAAPAASDAATSAEGEAATPAEGETAAAAAAEPAAAEAASAEAADDAAPEPAAAASAADDGFGKRVGHVKIHLGAARPSFGKELKYYGDLYGQPRVYPVFQLDYYIFNSALTLGVGTQFGYYKADGKAALGAPVDGKVEKDPNSSLEMTLIPAQINAKAQFSPFVNRWLVLSGWIGYQWLFIQETRFPPDNGGATSPSSGGTQSQTASSGPTTYVNGGTNTESVVGVAASFRLDPLDSRSVSSLHPIGIRSVYVTPFLEKVTTLRDKLGKFDRTNVGLAFTFETIK